MRRAPAFFSLLFLITLLGGACAGTSSGTGEVFPAWGLPPAQTRAFLLLSQGKETEARAAFESLRAQGNPVGSAMLELCRLHGIGMDQNRDTALKNLGQAFSDVPRSLAGYLYAAAVGPDCPLPEGEQALAYLTEESEKGNIPLRAMLADCYCSGLLTQEDTPRCVQLLTECAVAGYAPAQFELGERYEAGLGVPQDNARGEEWIARAAAQGFPLALHRD